MIITGHCAGVAAILLFNTGFMLAYFSTTLGVADCRILFLFALIGMILTLSLA